MFLDQNGIIVLDTPSAGVIVPLGFVVTPKMKNLSFVLSVKEKICV